MKYIVYYKVQTKTFPYERIMSMEAKNEQEAIELTEKQVAKRPEVTWVRATKVQSISC